MRNNRRNEHCAASSPHRKRADGGIFGKSKIVWALLFLVIAVVSIWAVTSQSKDFSLQELRVYIGSASPLPFAAAVLCMLGFIFFEGCAIFCACRAFRQNCGLMRSTFYSASDIYFSAITPSATGGQPACAYFMIMDGMPTIIATIALVANLTMYTLSLVVLGAISFVLRPQIFLSFGTLSKVMILIGFSVQIALSVLLIFLLKKTDFLNGICRKMLHFFAKIHIVRREEELQAKLKKQMIKYKECSIMLAGHRSMMMKTFWFNLLQRASLISVTMFAYLSTGGSASRMLDIFSLQSYVVLGSNFVPVPGAMGITDYLLLDGLRGLHIEDAANLDLLSRSLSFYCCIFICGISVLIQYFMMKKRGLTNDRRL